MPYLLITDFSRGLDTRRTRLTTRAGALFACVNAHITRGGEIEKRKVFELNYTLPAGTFGLHSASNNLYVFGSAASPNGLAPGIQYQQLVHPNGATMTRVLYAENFNGGIYAIAKYSDGSIYHYFRGTRVDTWDAVANGIASATTVGNVFAQAINQEANFTCTSLGSGFTITGPKGIPFLINCSTVDRGGVNDQTMTPTMLQTATALLPQITTIEISGTFQPEDTFTVNIIAPALNNYNQTFSFTGTASAMGQTVKNFGTKMYSTSQSLLYFSGVNDPTFWSDGSDPDATPPGSGFIDMANQDSGSETLNGLSVYQGKLAIFSRRNVQIWTMDADIAANKKEQVLNNIGTNAARSIVSFGDIDVFFIGDSGIRSLRARDASNAAAVSDIGTNIDTLIAANTIGLAPSVRSSSIGIIEPQDGRYWLAMGDKIYVYSYFSQSVSSGATATQAGVSAWSTYEPGFTIDSMCYCNGRVYCRDENDNIYIYGGSDNQTYDSCRVEVILPFADADKPAHMKKFAGFDAALDGTWDIFVNTNPLVPNAWVPLAVAANESTYPKQSMDAVGDGTHIGIRFVSEYSGYGRIGNVAIHFTVGDET